MLANGDGEWFGLLNNLGQRGVFSCDVAIADPGSRSATVLLKLSLEALKNLFGEFVDAQVVILRNIARILARRLRDAKILVTSNFSH